MKHQNPKNCFQNFMNLLSCSYTDRHRNFIFFVMFLIIIEISVAVGVNLSLFAADFIFFIGLSESRNWHESCGLLFIHLQNFIFRILFWNICFRQYHIWSIVYAVHFKWTCWLCSFYAIEWSDCLLFLQIHRMLRAGRDLWRSEQGHLVHGAKDQHQRLL